MNLKTDKKAKKHKAHPISLKFLYYDIVKWTGALPTIIYMRPKLIYESPAAKKAIRGAALVVSNHNSFIDPVTLHFVAWHRRFHIVATHELYKTKPRAWFFGNMQCIKVNKDNFNLETFTTVCDCLHNKGIVGLFPEGGINRNSDKTPVKPFKSGVVMMALRGKAPIVPVYIKPTKHWYNRRVIVVGEPIRLESPDGCMLPLKDIEAIADKLHDKETELTGLANR